MEEERDWLKSSILSLPAPNTRASNVGHLEMIFMNASLTSPDSPDVHSHGLFTSSILRCEFETLAARWDMDEKTQVAYPAYSSLQIRQHQRHGGQLARLRQRMPVKHCEHTSLWHAGLTELTS
jgi:hypothetical protein